MEPSENMSSMRHLGLRSELSASARLEPAPPHAHPHAQHPSPSAPARLAGCSMLCFSITCCAAANSFCSASSSSIKVLFRLYEGSMKALLRLYSGAAANSFCSASCSAAVSVACVLQAKLNPYGTN